MGLYSRTIYLLETAAAAKLNEETTTKESATTTYYGTGWEIMQMALGTIL